MSILKVEHLVKNYPLNDGKREVEVLKNISFEIEEKDFVAIMGRSGCGKTTLLKILGQIEEPTEGTILYKERETRRFSVDELAQIRRNEIGFVFQDFYLLDSLNVLENIMLPMIMNKETAEKMKEEAQLRAKQFGIETLLTKHPNELSGGEKQRAAICRALLNNPDLILADEPTGNLDSKSAKIVLDTLEKINEKYGKTVIMVTHDPMMASYCRKVIFLSDGKIMKIIERIGDRSDFYKIIVREMENIS